MPHSVTQYLPDILVGDNDFNTVERLLTEALREGYSPSAVFLNRELGRAKVVPKSAVPDSVVRLGTRLLYRDHEAGATRCGTLVPPGESRYGDGNISILSMLGAALLGLSEGQSISYLTWEGRIRTVSVLRILAQPKA
jgi:regulator of nucleoside diphosphate kinase